MSTLPLSVRDTFRAYQFRVLRVLPVPALRDLDTVILSSLDQLTMRFWDEVISLFERTLCRFIEIEP